MQNRYEYLATQSNQVPAHVIASTDAVIDTGVNLANSVIAIVKEVGEMLNNVPYVKSLSGVILQFIKIRDEVKSNKERCREIIDKVLRISKSIYDRLSDVAQSKGKDKLSRLEDHLGDCQRTLINVYAALEKYRSRNRISMLINRGLDDLNAVDRRVDELNTKLILDILVDIKLEQAASATILNQPAAPDPSTDSPESILPPKPRLMVEREDQLKTTLDILLRVEPSRIAIVGGGGFGKTTLARTILHHPDIVERYQSRHFLSCEGITDADTLLLGFGSVLGIKAAPSAMLASARQMLRTSTTLVCFDNFETPWEPFDTRAKVEELLETIADIPHLSLVITMRGEQRPTKVAWSMPLLPPLSTLSFDGATSVLRNIASNHTFDDFTLQLLKATDGIPLAITLISILLRDGESSESLWGRWSRSYTQVIHTGSDDRQSNLNRSISLSVYSLRMNKDGDASRQLLAALSLLPDGFPFNRDALNNLQEYLNHVAGSDIPRRRPKFRIFQTILQRATRQQKNQQIRDASQATYQPNRQNGSADVHSVVQTLRTVALIGIGETGTSLRIQMLSPIRLFCLEFLRPEVSLVLEKIVDYYISIMLNAENDYRDSGLYNQIVPEIQNIHSVFQRAYKAGYNQDISSLIYATKFLTDWSCYVGYTSKDTIQMALDESIDLHIPHARCLLSFGALCLADGIHSRAEKCFREATKIFKREGDTFNEAYAMNRLGTVLTYMKQLEQAEVALKTSLELHTQADNKKGQADVGLSLGSLYIDKHQYSEAEAALTTALQAYKTISDYQGRANTAKSLAHLHIDLGNLVDAEKFATESLAAAKRANHATGEGNALSKLGQIYLRTDKITDARLVLEQALTISKRQNVIINQLINVSNLVQVYIQSDQLSTAEALLTEYARIELDVIQIPIIFTTLGHIYICADHLDKAESHLHHALELFQKFQHQSWQAEVLSHLGAVYLKSNRLDDAEQVLDSIPDLGAWADVEMRRLWVLGELYTVKGKLEDAESSLNSAMVEAKYYQSSYQQGNIIRSLGTLHIKRGRIDKAIRAFKRALDFHCKAQWVSEQATDLRRLGEAYEMLGSSDEAKTAFEEADVLFESVREARTLKL